LIGIDTNVLVRYLTQDDPEQSAVANKFFQSVLSTSRRGFVSLVVLAEVCWVLQASYEVSDGELVALVENLLHTPQLILEDRDCVSEALQSMALARTSIAGFVDFLIRAIATSKGCEYCVTFDKKSSRSTGMKLMTSDVG
jgi:predicted nucleic-acid-binding protein